MEINGIPQTVDRDKLVAGFREMGIDLANVWDIHINGDRVLLDVRIEYPGIPGWYGQKLTIPIVS